MILDRGETAEDRESEVMTSPLNLKALYRNADQWHERVGANSDPHPETAKTAQPEGTWNVMTSPSELSKNPDDISGELCTGKMRQPRYLGVRVKNPVKDLILQKRSQATFSPCSEKELILENFEAEDHCPALTAALLGAKRPANHQLLDLNCPKRPTPYSTLSSCSLGVGGIDGKGEGPDSDGQLDVADIIQQMRQCTPVSIATVQVQDTPLCTNFLSELTFPYEVTASPLPISPMGGVSFFHWQVEQEEGRLAGVSPNQLAARDGDGDTLLHVAVAQGRRALSYVLARKMAALGLLELKERNGQTALQVSMAANQHLIVQDLLMMGAQISTTDRWGRSPLHVCAEKGHAQTLQAVLKALQSSTQQLYTEAVDYEGLTALHVAVLSHNAVVQELGGASLQCAGTQALLQRRKALAECVSTLLLMGASYRTKDHKSGRTSLHMAAEEANVELLRLFLDQPDSLAAVNAKAYNGNTALHLVSALQGRVAQVEAVKLLMRRGADPSIRNLENEQPAQLVPEGPTGDQVRRILKGRGGAQSRLSLY